MLPALPEPAPLLPAAPPALEPSVVPLSQATAANNSDASSGPTTFKVRYQFFMARSMQAPDALSKPVD
jgi:hypothetical protein